MNREDESRDDESGGSGDSSLTISRRVRLWLSILGLLTGALAGFYGLGSVEMLVGFTLSSLQAVGVVVLAGIAGALLLGFLAPGILYLLLGLKSWMEGILVSVPLSDILVGVIGLIFGLIIANLLGTAFSGVQWLRGVVPTVGALVFGYSGWIVAVHKKPDIVRWARAVWATGIFSRPGDRASAGPSANGAGQRVPKILDSSSIIDGRIADVCKTGFLEGPVVVPSFVLQEVQHIADSSDDIRRGRGRRGLDILNTMQKDLDMEVSIYEKKIPAGADVDSYLLQVSKELHGKVITNDYNLNKVAVLQGVPVLNINELANALKPMVIPGEQMDVKLIKEGKESGQGVGYLDDGTMVVVDDGQSHIGETISVVVTSVLQTSAGRMIFAKPEDVASAAQ